MRVAALLILVMVAGCAARVEHENLAAVPPEVRAQAAAVRVYEQGLAPPKITRTIGDVDAYSCKHLMTDPPASKGDALQRLRLKALQMGGTAVIDVVFDTRGTDTLGTNCWETVHAAGIAVVSE